MNADHASHFMRGADGGLVLMTYFGCADCADAAQEHARSGQARRDDLARDVARLWAEPTVRWSQLTPALDRLAAAYADDQPPPVEPSRGAGYADGFGLGGPSPTG